MPFRRADLTDLATIARDRWVAYPPRPILGGRVVDGDQLRIIALFEATVCVLNRMGANIPADLGVVRFENGVKDGPIE